MGNLKKGDLEQIFTPHKLTDFLIENCYKFYGGEITEILEPSAGSGLMLDRIKEHIPNIPSIQFDIEPQREDIIELNFLKNKLEYKKGRVTFMNPPFSKGLKFIYKSLEISDYCVAITSSNSFLNIDYDKYIIDNLYFIKKAKFSDGNSYGINMIAIRKKEELYDDFWD